LVFARAIATMILIAKVTSFVYTLRKIKKSLVAQDLERGTMDIVSYLKVIAFLFRHFC